MSKAFLILIIVLFVPTGLFAGERTYYMCGYGVCDKEFCCLVIEDNKTKNRTIFDIPKAIHENYQENKNKFKKVLI